MWYSCSSPRSSPTIKNKILKPFVVLRIYNSVPERAKGGTVLKAQELREQMRKEIIGQDRAIDAVVRAVMVADLGICDPRRPLATFLFLGPTGPGKSQIGRSLAN